MDSKQVIKNIKEFGFGICEGVLTNDECDKYIAEIRKIKKHLVDNNKDNFNDNQGFNACMIHLFNPDVFLPIISNITVVNICEELLGEEVIIHDITGAHAGKVAGRIHTDARLPITNTDLAIQVNAVYCLTDFNQENGGTRFIPKSHLMGRLPTRNEDFDNFEYVTPVAPRGSVIFFYAQTWHGSGANLSSNDRWSINSFYGRWWVKPNYDFCLCGEQIFNKLSDREKEIFGFNSRPSSSRIDGQYIKKQIKDLTTNYHDLMSIKPGEVF